MLTVAVVILNYNGRNLLEQFLPSVLGYSEGAEVIVADNGSFDDSVSFMQQHYPDVRLIINESNEGFAGGYNKALEQVAADYYVLLNSDVEVTPGWIWPIIDRMELNTQIGACQPKIRSYKQKQYFEYAGAAGGMLDKYGYPFCRGRVFDTIEKDEGQYNDATEVFWATGACMFVKSAIYQKLGGLDEAFFAHMEEIDLCWRIKNAGYEVWYDPESTIYHVGGATLQKSNPRKTFLNFRNGIVLLYKNLPSAYVFPVIFTRLVLDGIAGIQFLLRGQVGDTIAIVKAHFNFYANYFYWREKRRKMIKAGIYPRSYLKGWYKFSAVWKYFALKKTKYSELI